MLVTTISRLSLVLGVLLHTGLHAATAPWRRTERDRGEGVISVAIAVLIMAGLGALAWTAFQTLFEDTVDSTRSQIDTIGNG